MSTPKWSKSKRNKQPNRQSCYSSKESVWPSNRRQKRKHWLNLLSWRKRPKNKKKWSNVNKSNSCYNKRTKNKPISLEFCKTDVTQKKKNRGKGMSSKENKMCWQWRWNWRTNWRRKRFLRLEKYPLIGRLKRRNWQNNSRKKLKLMTKCSVNKKKNKIWRSKTLKSVSLKKKNNLKKCKEKWCNNKKKGLCKKCLILKERWKGWL